MVPSRGADQILRVLLTLKRGEANRLFLHWRALTVWHTPNMDENAKDGAAVRIPPPLVYLGAVIAGVLVHELVAPLPIGLALVLRIAAGTVVADRY